MSDWRSIAQARRYPLTDAEIERIGSALDALEATFRPLVNALPHSIEPALILSEAALAPEPQK